MVLPPRIFPSAAITHCNFLFCRRPWFFHTRLRHQTKKIRQVFFEIYSLPPTFAAPDSLSTCNYLSKMHCYKNRIAQISRRARTMDEKEPWYDSKWSYCNTVTSHLVYVCTIQLNSVHRLDILETWHRRDSKTLFWDEKWRVQSGAGSGSGKKISVTKFCSPSKNEKWCVRTRVEITTSKLSHSLSLCRCVKRSPASLSRLFT